MSTSEGQHRWECLERKLERQDWDGIDTYGGNMMGILGEGCWGWCCQERGTGEGHKGGLWMWWKRTWLRLKWRRKIQLIETTGEGKSAVATPDGKRRKKKEIYHYPCVCRLIIITLNDSVYACLSCDCFKICQRITNDLIPWLMLNLVNLLHVPLQLTETLGML